MKFPSEAGFPFEKTNKEKYLVLEIHYDNPLGLDNIVDSSGYRLYFTKMLRRYDAGAVFIGFLH